MKSFISAIAVLSIFALTQPTQACGYGVSAFAISGYGCQAAEVQLVTPFVSTYQTFVPAVAIQQVHVQKVVQVQQVQKVVQVRNVHGASAAAASSGGAAAVASTSAASAGGGRGVARSFSFRGPFGGGFSRAVSR